MNRCTHYILLDGRFDLMPGVQSGPSNHFAIQVNPMIATPIVQVGMLSMTENSTNHQVLFSFMDFLKDSSLRRSFIPFLSHTEPIPIQCLVNYATLSYQQL